MIALFVALVILYLGVTGDLHWTWWVIGGLALVAAATPEGRLWPAFRRLAERSPSVGDDPANMPGEDFEEWTTSHLRREGYEAEVVGGPGDGGCDVLAERESRTIAVQCKRRSGSVGVAAVQDAVTAQQAEGTDAAWLVTTGEPTDQARTLVRKTGVEIHEV